MAFGTLFLHVHDVGREYRHTNDIFRCLNRKINFTALRKNGIQYYFLKESEPIFVINPGIWRLSTAQGFQICPILRGFLVSTKQPTLLSDHRLIKLWIVYLKKTSHKPKCRNRQYLRTVKIFLRM